MNHLSSLIRLVFLPIVLVACNSTAEKPQENKPQGDKPQELQKSKKDTLERSYFEEQLADSLLLEKTKKEALLEVVKRFKGKDLDFSYVIEDSDTSYLAVTVQIKKYFEDEAYYAIIYTNMYGWEHIDIYKLGNQSIEHKVAGKEYHFPTDTIFDVNGDGTKDFLVKSHPLSSCCRANIYNIYLSPAAKKEVVTSYIDLVNPTFYPQEKLIRGVEYGHPGWTGLYKYRWRGERLDTLEYIYPNPTTKGCTFIKMHTSSDFFLKRNDIRKGTRLPSLPEEYKTVEDLDWFLLYGEGTFDTDF